MEFHPLYPTESDCEAQTKSSSCDGESSTILGALKRNQKNLQSRLDDCTKAIEALEQNPSLANVLELINKARH